MAAFRTFLVESYASASSGPDWISEQAHLCVLAAAVPRSVRHLRSILVPDDELCLHLFEADSAATLAAAVDSAAMTAPRIVEVTLQPKEVPWVP